MYIVVAAVVIIIVVAAVAAYVFLYMPSGGENNGGGGETVYTMGNATSLQFNVNITTSDGSIGTYLYSGKNLGETSTDILLRVDAEPDISLDTTFSYIMYAANQTSYTNATGTWDVSSFATDWPTYSTLFEGYISHNENWMTGDTAPASYTDDAGNTILLYGIMINPSLDDSMFQSM